MPTIEEKIQETLVNHGLRDSEAAEIMQSLKADPALSVSMDGRWGNDFAIHPNASSINLWLHARKHALLWIDKTNPNHWARGMFTDAPAPDTPKP